MWKTIAKRGICRNRQFHPDWRWLSRFNGVLGRPNESLFRDKLISGNFVPSSLPKFGSFEMGVGRSEILSQEDYYRSRFCFGSMGARIGLNGLCPKGYSSVAEAVSSTDVDEDASVDGKVQESVQEMSKEEKRLKPVKGMGQWKYNMLRRRQVTIEAEAWENAAKEYRELLVDMCKQKLAPNLPYVKSLFLGWFEPFQDAIIKEQELIQEGKRSRAPYAPYFLQLPADKMSVITMHKLMGLLMRGSEHGSVRVVQAACAIGDAIEQEVCRFCECRPSARSLKSLMYFLVCLLDHWK